MRTSIFRCAITAGRLVVCAHFVVPLSSAGGACEDLERLKLPHVTVTSAVKVPSGALVLKKDELPRADSSFFIASASAGVGALTVVPRQALPVAQRSSSLPATPGRVLSVVKVNKSGATGSRFGVPMRGRFVATNVTVHELIAAAYGGLFLLREDQVVGGPSWLRSEHFDVEAKVDADDQPPPDQLIEAIEDAVISDAFAMVRVVLEERFGLSVRRTTRDGPVYALTPARRDGQLGSVMKLSEVDCEAIMRRGPYSASLGADGKPLPPCGVRAGPGYIEGRGATIDQLAKQLARTAWVEREVLDRTARQGRYDFTLTFAPAAAPGQRESGAAVDPGPSLFTAVEEQLGLKLESRRAPIPIVVIDRVTRPTPN